jgi:NTE family protein
MAYNIGFVLAGGGGKGSYQVGVWKALREFGIDQNIKAVSGTSIGALNSALFIQGNLELAEQVWENISPSKVLTSKTSKLLKQVATVIKVGMAGIQNIAILLQSGLFTRDGLCSLIDEYLNLYDISCSQVPIFASACSIKGKKYFQLNQYEPHEIRQILLASTALPGIFPPEKINGVDYWDAFLIDNTPIEPVYELGCNFIIVVHLDRTTVINHENYPKSKIIEIIPKDDLGNFVTGTFDFTREGALKRIQTGYEDTKKILQPIFDTLAIQVKTQISLKKMYSNELEFKKNLSDLKSERSRLKEELKNLL